MKKLTFVLLFMMVLTVAGCGGVVASYPVGPNVPSLSYTDARKDLIAQLESAQIEKAGFIAATMRYGFKFKLRDDGIDFMYERYRGLLSDSTVATTSSCDFEHMDNLSVVEYETSRAISFRYEVPLGRRCDDLAVYFPNKERAFAFANNLLFLKEQLKHKRKSLK